MSVPYRVEGESFQPDKARSWSDRPITSRPRQRTFDLHPDGDRVAVAAADLRSGEKTDKLVFLFNFFDELRGSRR